MSAEAVQHIEGILLNVTLAALFLLMGYAIHDVMKKNDVPKIGRFVAYGVLGLGGLGFVVKGIIQLFYIGSGV
jgi:hypothetical protein